MFLITMAGASSRFFKAGYQLPKYMLPVEDATVFDVAIRSFRHYFATDKFIFVLRDIFNTADFVAEHASALGIADFEIVKLDDETTGQAETAYIGLAESAAEEPVYIFNIDTFRYDYLKPSFIADCDGYLEVFRAEGEHWSFVEPKGSDDVVRTTEKDRISDLCSDGLYYFKSVGLYRRTFLAAQQDQDTTRGEYYVAPLYNRLITAGLIVKYEIINLDQIDFCGTPDEYESLISDQSSVIGTSGELK